MAQERFWKELHELKFNIGFVQRLLLEAEAKERLIKAVIAITSSASIGAWVVWKELAVLWGAIIAGSQVLSVIYPLLPYADRLKTFSLMLKDLELLFIEAEHKWQSVADGSMYAQKIDSERTLLHKQKSNILNKYMPTSIFPENPRFADRAEQDAANYFSRYYPEEYEPSKSFGTTKEAAKDGALT
ncbi:MULTISPECIES: hypothetical protein [Pseudomonas]|uniref:hypothetical protein n=1 Tax=Pseudomonas TaxID=286 RepID=UPI001CBF8D25|nr:MULTISPECIES: hypothetical protein [unclassified Pseudomonas]